MNTQSFILHRAAVVALVLLAFILPFEMDTPWITVGPIGLTNVEITLALFLLLAIGHWWRFQRARPTLPRWCLVLGGLFLFSLLLSSLLAPEFRANALKATFRTFSGAALALGVFQVARSAQAGVWVVVGVVSGGLLAALIGLAEFVQGTAFTWLNPFRVVPTMAGPFLRLTGPFDYANQAAMYLEATLPLLLTLVWIAHASGRRWLAFILVLLSFVYVEAAFLTFSRASFATILLVAITLAGLLWIGTAPSRRQQALVWAAVAGITLVLIPVNLLLSPTFQLRLRSEGDNEWYQARIEAPRSLRVTANETVRISVTVTNEGALTWQHTGANPVMLIARWVQPETELEWAQQLRWPLGQPLPPGESVALDVSMQTPQKSGDYLLMWDLLQEGIVVFGAKNGMITSSRVTVTDASAAVTADMPLVQARTLAPPIPGRLTLWQVAWQLFTAYPLTGIGLDNFRLIYGRELGRASWNTSVHTNSWYLEMLVSVGLLGALPFFAWLAGLAGDIIYRLRQAGNTMWLTAIAAGLLAYFIHGLLDYFLLFNATALLFWLLVGLWFSQRDLSRSVSSPGLS